MAKELKFTFKENEYTLGYSRRTIKDMEDRGFDISKADSKPMSTLPMLFSGAFKLHHRRVREEEIDTIFKSFTDKDLLFNKLIEMYSEPFEVMMAEPEEDEKNAIKWTVNF